jgi:hypothetical protein
MLIDTRNLHNVAAATEVAIMMKKWCCIELKITFLGWN